MLILTSFHDFQTTAGQFSQVRSFVLVAIYLIVNVLVIEQTEQRQVNFFSTNFNVCNMYVVSNIEASNLNLATDEDLDPLTYPSRPRNQSYWWYKCSPSQWPCSTRVRFCQ